MGVKTFGTLIAVGRDILATVRDAATNSMLAQIGDVRGNAPDSSGAEWWQHVGFASRPSKPNAGNAAAQCIVYRQGDRDVAFASRDTRTQAIYGQLDDGETCVFATGPDGTSTGRVLLKKDGSINVYAKQGNAANGAGMTIALSPMDNAIRLVNGAGFALIIDGSGITMTTGAASITLGASGKVDIVGTGQTTLDGSAVMLGVSAAAAVPGVNNALHGPNGTAGVASTKVFIAT